MASMKRANTDFESSTESEDDREVMPKRQKTTPEKDEAERCLASVKEDAVHQTIGFPETSDDKRVGGEDTKAMKKETINMVVMDEAHAFETNDLTVKEFGARDGIKEKYTTAIKKTSGDETKNDINNTAEAATIENVKDKIAVQEDSQRSTKLLNIADFIVSSGSENSSGSYAPLDQLSSQPPASETSSSASTGIENFGTTIAQTTPSDKKLPSLLDITVPPHQPVVQHPMLPTLPVNSLPSLALLSASRSALQMPLMVPTTSAHPTPSDSHSRSPDSLGASTAASSPAILDIPGATNAQSFIQAQNHFGINPRAPSLSDQLSMLASLPMYSMQPLIPPPFSAFPGLSMPGMHPLYPYLPMQSQILQPMVPANSGQHSGLPMPPTPEMALMLSILQAAYANSMRS